jgi:hypothetical protein
VKKSQNATLIIINYSEKSTFFQVVRKAVKRGARVVEAAVADGTISISDATAPQLLGAYGVAEGEQQQGAQAEAEQENGGGGNAKKQKLDDGCCFFLLHYNPKIRQLKKFQNKLVHSTH